MILKLHGLSNKRKVPSKVDEAMLGWGKMIDPFQSMKWNLDIYLLGIECVVACNIKSSLTQIFIWWSGFRLQFKYH
jgi:hypothetical protein